MTETEFPDGERVATTALIDRDRSDADRAKLRVELTTITPKKSTQEILIDGDAYYTRVDGAWYTTTKAAVGVNGDLLEFNPAARLDEVLPYLKSVRQEQGTYTYEGEAWTVYWATADPGAAGGNQVGDSDKALWTYKLWVDPQNVVRRYQFREGASGVERARTGSIDHINEPVTISVPKNAPKAPRP